MRHSGGGAPAGGAVATFEQVTRPSAAIAQTPSGVFAHATRPSAPMRQLYPHACEPSALIRHSGAAFTATGPAA
jgi:hypothetical protein